MADDDDDLRQAVNDLRRQVARLEGQVRYLAHPMGRVFVAQRDGDTGFQERTPTAAGDDLADFDDGRQVDDGDPMGLIELDDDETAVLTFQNGSQSANVALIPKRDCPGTNTVSLGSTGEGSESPATNTASLTIPGDSNTASVSFPFLTRVVYNDAGDEKLYGFQRMLTLSCNGGKLKIEVSAETGYEVDAPEDCT